MFCFIEFYFLINAEWLNVPIIHLIALGLPKLGNIVAKTLFLVMFPGVAKLAGRKPNVLLPWRLNEERVYWKQRVTHAHYNKLTFEEDWGRMFCTFSSHKL